MCLMCFGVFWYVFNMFYYMVCACFVRVGVFLVCFWYVVGTFLVRLVWFGVFFYMFLMHFGMWLMCF